MKIAKLLSSVSAVTLLAVLPAMAQQAADTSRDEVFGLGQITVHGRRDDTPMGGATINHADIWTYNKVTLDEAVRLIPNVDAVLAPGGNSTQDATGRRNESDIFVRGFGRWQVPLLVDGVRVYLPADNRLDMSRFLTGDIAEVQIQKGYASVIDGPGAMGGTINMVTRKPTRELEAEAYETLNLDSDLSLQGHNGYASIGTLQSKYYVQGSINYSKRDPWKLSNDYTPTATSLQPRGPRLNSQSRDMRVAAKAGFLPNDTDEYVLNVAYQQGEKGGLLNVYNNPPVPANAFWRWPDWNIKSIAGLGYTQMGGAYLKTKLYYNEFDTTLSTYDDIRYTTQSTTRAFISPYNDYGYGADVELGGRIGNNELKGAIHFRIDEHNEHNLNQPDNATARFEEPVQHQGQRTWSYAFENTYHATPDLDLVAGISYDDYVIMAAGEFNSTTRLPFSYPLGGADGLNLQGAAIWNYSETGQAHISVSDRVRFPNFFELYSSRFGTAVPNPALGPERAINYEIGLKEEFFGNTRVEAAIFYSDVQNLIQTIQVSTTGPALTQQQNVGDGEFYGYEISFDTQLTDELQFGANYGYIFRQVKDPSRPVLRLPGVPKTKGFMHLTWRPMENVILTPNIEIAGDRWSERITSPVQAFPYISTGSYTLVNFQAEYRPIENLSLAVGGKNLTDQNYELAWGQPNPGRTYYVKARVTF